MFNILRYFSPTSAAVIIVMALAMSWLAEIDRLDARTIALYAAIQVIRPAPWPVAPAEEKLRELSHFRHQ